MKTIDTMPVPLGWRKFRDVKEDEQAYVLEVDKNASQPIIVFPKTTMWGRGKGANPVEGWTCVAGHFAGTSCRISPERPTIEETMLDCHDFMRKYNEKNELDGLIDRCWAHEMEGKEFTFPR